jgi:hypothetical protein
LVKESEQLAHELKGLHEILHGGFEASLRYY